MDDGTSWYDVVLLGGSIAGALVVIATVVLAIGRLPVFKWLREQVEETLDERAARRVRVQTEIAVSDALRPIRHELEMDDGGGSLRDAIRDIQEMNQKHLWFADLRDLELKTQKAKIDAVNARLTIVERAKPTLDNHEKRIKVLESERAQ